VAREGFELSNILRDFKKYTSVEIIQATQGNNFREQRRMDVGKIQDLSSWP